MIKVKTGIRTGALRSRTQRKRSGLKFHRFFSQEGVSPFDELEWERRIAEITDDSGKVIFRQEDVEVPKAWSELATKIAVSKYFYGDIANGIDPKTGGRESSVRQLVHRVTRTISDWGAKDGYFSDDASAEAFYSDLTWLCLVQCWPLSAIWDRERMWTRELLLQPRRGRGRAGANSV
jgi:ribonucleoside-diphosphate reductase alpha chain